MKYKRVTVYFLSGTGNSYSAARWLEQTATQAGASAALIPIAKGRPKSELEGGPEQLVGIYHPTHGLMPPWSMIKFLVRMPWGRGAHAIVVATRGGIPLRPVLIPGGSGLALFFPLLVLLLKGYRLRGGMSIDMPVNMLNLHPGLHPKNVDYVIRWGKKRHDRLVDAVLGGGRYWHPVNLLWEFVWCIPFWFYPVFPIAYLLVGRVFMAKLMFADTSCVGCGRCARNCPCEAIELVGKKPKTPFWTHRCEVCMRCMGYCKFHAVEASHLWIAPAYFLTSFLSASSLQGLLSYLVAGKITLVTPMLELISIGLTFIALVIFYYVFFGLQRLDVFRKFFTYTTFTKLYSRRYHAPEITARELTGRQTKAKSADPK